MINLLLKGAGTKLPFLPNKKLRIIRDMFERTMAGPAHTSYRDWGACLKGPWQGQHTLLTGIRGAVGTD